MEFGPKTEKITPKMKTNNRSEGNCPKIVKNLSKKWTNFLQSEFFFHNKRKKILQK
jgi:hypothetical protein